MRRLLLAAAALALFLYLRNRDAVPARSEGTRFAGELTDTEPVLGYDGMDVETLLDWVESADLDRATLQRIRSYERAHRSRDAVITALDGLID